MATSLSALEKVIAHYSETLGIMSWKNIQTGINGEAAAFSTCQRRMAEEMAEMVEKHCPVMDSLMREIAVSGKVEILKSGETSGPSWSS